MQLMTKELEARFAEVGRQEDLTNPKVIAKYFNPTGAGTWYATEYDSDDKIFFGYVSIFGDYCDEWGDFSLEELQNFEGSFGLGIERDLHWVEKGIFDCDIPSLKSAVKTNQELANN